jgi:hypothetical protein
MIDHTEVVRACEATCPACGHHIAAPFFDGGMQPLATLGWPRSAEAARAMKRLPINFVRCVECGHVFNPEFRYDEVPYSEKPNLMFNRGARWSRFVEHTIVNLLAMVPKKPTVVEIGHGDASLLAAMAERCPDGRFCGFDPHGARGIHRNLELRAELFDPGVHLKELAPDIVVSRHVLEHLASPLAFLQHIAFAAAQVSRAQLCYFEVPCIDRALEGRRSVDFYYEHNSQFTTESFKRMLARCGAGLSSVSHGYDGEVIFAYVSLGAARRQLDSAGMASQFRTVTGDAVRRIHDDLDELLSSGAKIAIWGGTGKSAAFINRYGLDAERFPIVVDSDAAKVGSFVPGAGQQIRSAAWLKSNPADVVIIPPQWRARDIILEMEREGIGFKRVLIEHEGALIDYFADEHPYRRCRDTESHPGKITREAGAAELIQ